MKLRIKWDKIILVIFTMAAVGLFVSTLYNIHEQNIERSRPVDVLRNWKLCTGSYNGLRCVDSISYHPGDLLHVESHFTKLVDKNGKARRWIQCYRPGTTKWGAEYLANEQGTTQSKVTNGVAYYNIALPFTLDQLPNTCRLHVVVTYNYNQYNPSFSEQAWSNPFTVEPLTQASGETSVYGNDTTLNATSLNSQISIPDTSRTIIVYQTPDMETEENAPATNDNSNTVVTNLLQATLNRVNQLLTIHLPPLL